MGFKRCRCRAGDHDSDRKPETDASFVGALSVPWGVVRIPGCPVVRPGRIRPVGRRTGGFAGGVSAGSEPSGGYSSAFCA